MAGRNALGGSIPVNGTPGRGNPAGYYGGSERVSAEDPENQAGQSAIGGSRTYNPVTGQTSYETQYGETTEQNLATRDKYNAAAEARRAAALQQLMMQQGGGGAGTPSKGMAFDEEGARAAAFARAKDQAGQTARASLDALREHLGGNLGGAAEQQRSAEVIGGAAGNLGEFTRDQMIMDLARAGEIGDRNYAGDLEREKMANDQKQSLYALFSSGGKGPIY